MTGLTDLGIAQIRDGVRDGAFSAREVAEAFVASVETGRGLNAFTVETPHHALAAADAADSARASGELKPLSGVPLGIKDLFATEGVHTTACSRILEGFRPTYESTVSGNLRAAGAGMLGKLNMDEFAMGSSNETSAYGPVVSPWRPIGGSEVRLTPGGSSGGSAAAVAARMTPGATGTEAGGSIRQPAAFVGITGVKPTYGRCSRWGVVAFASSLDHPGALARDVRDCAILLEAMSGYDPKDATSLNLPVPRWEEKLTANVRGLRIGIPREYRIDGTPSEIEAVWQLGIDLMREAGAEIVEVSLPHTRYALPAYYIIAPAEASSNLARYDGVRYGRRADHAHGGLTAMYEATRSEGFGAEVKRRIMIGTYVLSAGFYDAYFIRAQKVRALIARDFTNVWEHCDVLLTPTVPSAAFELGERSDDPISMYLNDIFAVPSSLAGLPAIAVPVSLDGRGLPLGLQFVGKALDEQTVFNAGLALERAAGFSARPDCWW